MNKFNEFYAKITENNSLRNEIESVLDGKKIEDASDDQLLNLGEIAKRMGFEFTLEEVRNYFGDSELDDDALDAVAGGKGFGLFGSGKSMKKSNVSCTSGIGSVSVSLSGDDFSVTISND